MKKMIHKKTLSILLLICILFGTAPFNALNMLCVTAESELTEGDYSYVVCNGCATIKNVKKSISGKIIIPSTLGGYTVTGIDDKAFGFCKQLTSIKIPDSVANIGDEAFLDCTSLISITIPNGVTSIRNSAFYNCSSLTDITIPDSVTSIGFSAFYNCSSLTNIIFPDSLITIGEMAFYACASLKNFTFPNCVTNIGEMAFNSCTSLTKITIPESMANIGNWAFTNCTSLKNIEVSNNNPKYSSEDGVLFNKNKTIIFQYPEGNARTGYAISSSVTDIFPYAFSGCASLKNIEVSGDNPDYSSADGVLFNKDKTTIIQYPAGNTRTKYAIPNSVKSICDCAFFRCNFLTEVFMPDSITYDTGEEDDYLLFNNCFSLTNIEVSDDNPDYSSVDGVLFNKDKTELVQYPTGNKRTNYTVPDSVISIGYGAFEHCIHLTSITLQDSLENIFYYAFFECTSLTDVYFGGTEADWNKILIFTDNNALTNANIHFQGKQSSGGQLSGEQSETLSSEATSGQPSEKSSSETESGEQPSGEQSENSSSGTGLVSIGTLLILFIALVFLFFLVGLTVLVVVLIRTKQKKKQ